MRQGKRLSNVLFLVFSTGAAIDEDIGFQYGRQRTSHVAYADDLILTWKSPLGLQMMLHKMDPTAVEAGLYIYESKFTNINWIVYGKRNSFLR